MDGGTEHKDVGCAGRARSAGPTGKLRLCRKIRLGSWATQVAGMNPSHLIDIARRLAAGSGRRGRPRQTDLCRAVSAAYYAQFHTLARCCADMLAGASSADRSQTAWEQTYRALEHGHARNQCLNQAAMSRFAVEIWEFGKHFVDMQRHRHFAEYAPVTNFGRSQAEQLVDETERMIRQFNDAPVAERRAFALHVLLRTRRD